MLRKPPQAGVRCSKRTVQVALALGLLLLFGPLSTLFYEATLPAALRHQKRGSRLAAFADPVHAHRVSAVEAWQAKEEAAEAARAALIPSGQEVVHELHEAQAVFAEEHAKEGEGAWAEAELEDYKSTKTPPVLAEQGAAVARRRA